MKHLALVLLLALPLHAAVSTSALTGRVTSGGKAVGNATVTATSAALQHERVTVTGRSGTYWLGALPPGEYEVTFAHKGMQSLTRRAVVELARVARADAQLEPSEDEDSVTSTATTISVVHDTAWSTHRDAKALDQLPVPIDSLTAFYLAPRSYSLVPELEIDGALARTFQQELLQSETTEEMTYVRQAQPVELARGGDATIVARTRSGGEQLSLSIRDTITNAGWLGKDFAVLAKGGLRNFGEATIGGHLVPQRLWFFGALWNGDRADSVPHESKGFQLKLTGQLGERQNLTATYTDGDISFQPHTDFSASLASIVHTAQWSPRLLSEIRWGRADTSQHAEPFPPAGPSEDQLSAKASYVAGDHVVSGGIDLDSGDLLDARSIWVNDRIWLQRWVVNAGVRYHDGGDLAPYAGGAGRDNAGLGGQIAVAYDLRGRGRNAITASASRYSIESYDHVDEFTLGYVMALGSTGSARLGVVRGDYGIGLHRNSLQLDSSYRLFDRFEAGLNYTYTDLDRERFSPLFQLSANAANAWFSAEVPLGGQSITAMIAYRYATSPYDNLSLGNQHAFDVALRWTVPVTRVALTLGADARNVLDRGPYVDYPRIVRGWIRIRL